MGRGAWGDERGRDKGRDEVDGAGWEWRAEITIERNMVGMANGLICV